MSQKTIDNYQACAIFFLLSCVCGNVASTYMHSANMKIVAERNYSMIHPLPLTQKADKLFSVQHEMVASLLGIVCSSQFANETVASKDNIINREGYGEEILTLFWDEPLF